MRTIDLARAVGMSTQGVRDYEDWGVLPPVERLANGYRGYTDRHLLALRAVRALLAAGYARDEMIAIMQAANAGEVEQALALVDARHARVHAARERLRETIAAIRNTIASAADANEPHSIGQVARLIGVRPSTLRFWETLGLVTPARDPHSRYRAYDTAQVGRLRAVALLRQEGFAFDAIGPAIDDLTSGDPVAVKRAEAHLRRSITETSRACAAATALLWTYLSEHPDDA